MDLDIAMIQEELMLEPQIIFACVSRISFKLLVNITEKAHIKTLLKVRIKEKKFG